MRSNNPNDRMFHEKLQPPEVKQQIMQHRAKDLRDGLQIRDDTLTVKVI